MSTYTPNPGGRAGAAAIEMILVMASFVVAVIVLVQVGQAAIASYFCSGDQLLSTPFF